MYSDLRTTRIHITESLPDAEQGQTFLHRPTLLGPLGEAAVTELRPQITVGGSEQIAHEQTKDKRIAELERLLEIARYEATHDEMTGALNNRGIHEKFLEARPGTIMVVGDVVNFKAINAIPRIGFSVGDEAIKTLVWIYKDLLRDTDYVARPSGDEIIALLMPNRLTRSTTARILFAENKDNLLERFRQPVRDYIATEYATGETPSMWNSYSDRPVLGVDVSFGAALWEEGMTYEETRNMALQDMKSDEELLHSKLGRYRTPEPTPSSSPSIAI